MRHQAVAEYFSRNHAIIPLRFGVMYSSHEKVHTLLESRADSLATGLNRVEGCEEWAHAIVGNSIFSNGELGINLGPPDVTANDAGDGDAGPNNNQNYPVLAAAPGGVQGTFNSTPNGTFTIHYYGNTACDPSGNGEGQTFLGGVSVTTDVQRQRAAAALHRRGRPDRDRDGHQRDQRHVGVLVLRHGAGVSRSLADQDRFGRPDRVRSVVQLRADRSQCRSSRQRPAWSSPTPCRRA